MDIEETVRPEALLVRWQQREPNELSYMRMPNGFNTRTGTLKSEFVSCQWQRQQRFVLSMNMGWDMRQIRRFNNELSTWLQSSRITRCLHSPPCVRIRAPSSQRYSKPHCLHAREKGQGRSVDTDHNVSNAYSESRLRMQKPDNAEAPYGKP